MRKTEFIKIRRSELLDAIKQYCQSSSPVSSKEELNNDNARQLVAALSGILAHDESELSKVLIDFITLE